MSKVVDSRQSLARRTATSSSPERRSTYAHARQTGVTSGGRSTLTPCQNVETEFMTPAATLLHNKSFLRAVTTTYFSTPYVAHYSFQRARAVTMFTLVTVDVNLCHACKKSTNNTQNEVERHSGPDIHSRLASCGP